MNISKEQQRNTIIENIIIGIKDETYGGKTTSDGYMMVKESDIRRELKKELIKYFPDPRQ